MSRSPGGARRSAWIATAVGLAALSGWTATAVAAPAPALQGWWTSFTFWSGPAIGALVLLLIRRLVGGEWGEAFAPELEPLARATLLVVILAVPVLIAPQAVFGWARAPQTLDPQVRRFYLNPFAFDVRQLVFLGGLSLIAWRLPRIEGPHGRLAAGLALVFYGIGVTLASVDWTLSLGSGFTSSASGMTLATAQLASGLAYAALQGVSRPSRSAAGDLGALLFATLLGLSYLVFVDYLVVWYGDRPVQSAWYVARVRGLWGWAVVAALVLGFVGPTLMLLLRGLIGTRAAVFGAGAGALAGLALLAVWRHAPAFGAAALLPAGLAMIAQGGVFVGLTGGWPRLGAPAAEARARAE